MQTLAQDLRYAARMLLKQPGFTLVAILTLALGIGANTAIFSLIHAVLLRPLAYPESERLVRVWGHAPERGRDMAQAPLSYPRFEAIRDGQEVFEEIAATSGGGFTLTGHGEPEQVIGGYASARLFETLRVRPVLGRGFLPEEDKPGGAHVAIVSYPFWQKHFNGDAALLGQTINLDGVPHAVVGILTARLPFPFDEAQLFVPRVLDTPGMTPVMLRQGTGFLNCTARLKPGVTMAQANEAIRVVGARYRQTFPGQVDSGFGLKVIPFQEEAVGQARPAFYTLSAAVGCVLLIACVNVANLLLARLAGRRKEIAIRAALGAGRARLARQFLTESVLLTGVAGCLGVLLAMWGVDFMRSLGPEVIPRASEVHISGQTLTFTLVVSLATGLLLGVAPAMHAARRADLLLPATRYPKPEQQADFFEKMIGRLDALPGVHGSAAVVGLPLTENGGTMFYSVIGRPLLPVQDRPSARYGSVSPGHFGALQIPLLGGRTFTERDRADQPPVMLINQTMAKRLFPDNNVIGQRILCSVSNPTVTEIVGIVGDVRSASLAEAAREEMYFPMFQRGESFMKIVVRAVNPQQAEALAPAVRAAVHELDAEQPIAGLQTMAALVARSVSDRKLTAWLLAGFATLALLLAAIGIYGVTAYGVAQRTREIGVRLALGAQRGDVFRLIVQGGMKPILWGVGVGLVAVFGLTRLMASLLYGIGANDPLTLGGVVLLLVAVALLANFLPARRAMRISPVMALREE